MRKSICLTAAAVLTVGALAGCGGSGGGVQTGGGGAIQFMMTSDHGTSDAQFVMKKIFKEKFDTDVSFILNPITTHLEKLNLLIASNDLPDIVSPLPDGNAKDIGPRGALAAVSNYLDKMPNYRKYLMEDPRNYVSVQASDGNVYSVARFTSGNDARYTPIIRKDLLEELGVPAPKTFAQLYDFLAEVKAKKPNSKGIVNREKMNFINDYGTNYGTNLNMMYDEAADKFVFGPTTAGFRELISDFNRLYAAGLLDSEFFSAGDEDWTQKMISGDGVFTLNWPEYADTFNKDYRSLKPEDKTFNTGVILPLTSKTRPQMYVQKVEEMNSWTSWGISAKTKSLDKILAIADYMFTPEGIEIGKWGEGGANALYTEENGKRKFKSNVKTHYNESGTLDVRTVMALGEDHLARVNSRADEAMPAFSAETTDVLNRQYDEAGVRWYVSDSFIRLAFSDAQNEDIKAVKANLDIYVTENALKLIIGELPLSDMEKVIGQMKALGSDKLEQIYADAYAAYKTKLSEVK